MKRLFSLALLGAVLIFQACRMAPAGKATQTATDANGYTYEYVPNDPSDTGCRLNAAKNAALLLADLLDDAGVDGDQHNIALVSFASSASTDVGLTPAAGVVTDNGMNDTAFEAALAAMEACGGTSIGSVLSGPPSFTPTAWRVTCSRWRQPRRIFTANR